MVVMPSFPFELFKDLDLRDLLALLPLEDFDDLDKYNGVWLGLSEEQDGASLRIKDGSMEELALIEGVFEISWALVMTLIQV